MEACLEVLQQISEDPSVVDTHDRFKSLVAKIHRLGKRGQRDRKRHAIRSADQAAMAATGIVQQSNLTQRSKVTCAAGSEVKELLKAQSCYVCKNPFTELHHFYHQLCPGCASLNWEKRFQRADLCGRYALVTGGRICLLYTSPSPRDRTRSRMPSSA